MIVLSLLSSFLVQRDKLYINKLLIPVYHFIFRCLYGNMPYSIRSAQHVWTRRICIQLFVRIFHISLVTFPVIFAVPLSFFLSLSLSLSLYSLCHILPLNTNQLFWPCFKWLWTDDRNRLTNLGNKHRWQLHLLIILFHPNTCNCLSTICTLSESLNLSLLWELATFLYSKLLIYSWKSFNPRMR